MAVRFIKTLGFTGALGILAAMGIVSDTARAVVIEPSPARIKSFLEKCESSRKGAISQLEHTLRGLRSEGSSSPAVSRRIREIEQDLRSLRANKEPVVPTLAFPPEAGAIGRLPKLSCHVDQILGEDTMLVRCFFSVKVPVVRHFQAYLETVVRPEVFLVRGLDTRNLNEGMDAELTDVFEIGGQETYKSASGAVQKAWVITPFDMKAIEPFFRVQSAGPSDAAR